jgi:monofunctional biosynthetic peptidoglycan transglycosylase
MAPSPSKARIAAEQLKTRTIQRVVRIVTSPYRALKALCFALGVFTLLLTVALAVSTYAFFRSLPDLKVLGFPQLRKTAQKLVYRKLESGTGGRAPSWVEISDISRDFLYSIVMSEDSTFFEHDGIDIDAIAAAAIVNLRKKTYEAGASTISQQVVKNLFLTDEKTIVRKLKEVVVTERLEGAYTKNEILEVYLNIAEFGPDLYGVRAAAQHYFGKKPSEINAAEGAFIAIMLPSPRKFHYSVFENQNITKGKKKKIRRILGDMLANEFISPKQYRDYLTYDYFNEQERRKPAKNLKRR